MKNLRTLVIGLFLPVCCLLLPFSGWSQKTQGAADPQAKTVLKPIRPSTEMKPVAAETKKAAGRRTAGPKNKDSRSITVISPGRGDFASQGEPLDILWNVDGDLGTDCMKISLLRREAGATPAFERWINGQYHDTRQGQSTHYQQGYSWPVPVSPNLQGPAYQVRVQTCDGIVGGVSGSFLFPGMNPEFSVNNIRVSPSTLVASIPGKIRADIVNMGGVNSSHYRVFNLDLLIRDADDNVLVQETFDSVLLGAPPLGFTGRYLFNYSYTPVSEGPHKASLTVQSYPGGEVMDPYQENNTDQVSFDVQPFLPDLVVCMKKENHVKPPGSFTFPARVTNIGHAASEPAKLKFWVSGNGARHYDVRGLDPGESASPQRTLYWGPLVTGSNSFEVHIDYNEQIPELYNNNNNLLGRITKGTYGNNSEIICSDHPDAKTP